MSGQIEEEERTDFEIAVVVPKRSLKEECDDSDGHVVELLVQEFHKVGLIVDTVSGLHDGFIKLAAPLETLGRAAAELRLNKRTQNGVDVQFEWDKLEAFVRQPDGSLFSWWERYHCFRHIIYGIVNMNKSVKSLRFDEKEIQWESGESLLRKLESEGVVKLVFPLHDEFKRKQLLRNWALNCRDFTKQPIDDIYTYFGTKIATYFAFLGMYTKWMLFPAAFALVLQLIDFGSLQFLMLPLFSIFSISWAALFFQFWKRKNAALLARWQISYSVRADPKSKNLNVDQSRTESHTELMKKSRMDKSEAKEAFQKKEWFGHIIRLRNDAIIISSIVCLQMPFEIVYTHFHSAAQSDYIKYGMTVAYTFAIQYFKKVAGKLSVKLVKNENNENTEYMADSLVYKVFGLYFMQSYIGAFYLVLLHRDFKTIRQILIQRLIVSEVLENLTENSIPYLTYNYNKYRAVRNKSKRDKGSLTGKINVMQRVEKEYLKPAYSSSIGGELEDGLFDDFLELALKFGKILMFSCVYPLAFILAVVSNVAEIRTDALKLLTVYKRPVPRAAATIGAWLNIFQFLTVMSICTNCTLFVWLYDQEGNWKIEPGLVAILAIEHLLLLIKFGFSRLVPEEPDWVRANRMKNAEHAQDIYSKQLLSSSSVGEEALGESKKIQ